MFEPEKKSQIIIEKLENILGKENVLIDVEDRYVYAFDAFATNAKPTLPDYVVLPSTTAQISEIMKIAFENSIPVIARGAATNMAGCCIPVDGGIVIHTSKMNKILDINTQNLTCRVQPGVVVDELQKAVEKVGLLYPPDPSNLKVSTMGGSVALSSSGPRTFKYGGTKDYVIDLEVVLSDGKIIRTGSSTVKNVTGYNLTQLFIGSEGTLGIVTEIQVKLIPKPDASKIMLVYFENIDDAANAVNEIINAKLTPSVLDIMDKPTMQAIEKFYPSGLLTDMDAALFIEVDGNKNLIEEEAEKIKNICSFLNAKNIKIAQNEKETEEIWTARRASFSAVAKLAPNVVAEDAVVPREKMPEMIKEIKRICQKYNVHACIMGHAGDGNLHPNFSLDLRNKDEADRFEMAISELFESAVKLGGTITGEHGIGLAKTKFLSMALDPVVLSYMRQIKNLFDPKGILNPKKAI
jgi:glycolate oxidase